MTNKTETGLQIIAVLFVAVLIAVVATIYFNSVTSI